MGLLELERLERPFKELEIVHEAQRMATAYHDPKRLWTDEHIVRAQIFAGPNPDRVRQIIEAYERATYRKRIDGD